MKGVHLTQRELDVMSVLWELGEATAAEVRDRVDPDLAYTSISTVIRLLETKKYVAHRKGEGKTHLYYPLIEASAAGKTALGRVMEKIYGGSPVTLLANLIDQHRLTDKELARMRELLDTHKKRK
ncbi:MAG: BlaI/MecI/CopY family transcriptional regulator [Gemmatimonadales bacterium]|nr:BlaI/MecI/CopY family transcriptional regulator [Gemmatimonadales bacterium]